LGEGFTRRLFLKASIAFGFLATLPFRAWSFFLSGLQVRTVEQSGLSFDPKTGVLYRGGKTKAEPYRLTVDGLVNERLSLSYADLSGLPQVTQISDFHCVEGWSVRDLRWQGFRFSEIVRRAKPKPEARYAVFHALGTTRSQPSGLGHYVESFPVAHLLHPGRECLLALRLDGKPLSDQQGAPLRLISPYDLGYKGAKFVGRIEFSDKEQLGWWTLANPIYPSEAPVPDDRLRKRPKTRS
jgi:DMSO/TMAO reductase YedYZ molybdopterin-dependent catalytic subunit